MVPSTTNVPLTCLVAETAGGFGTSNAVGSAAPGSPGSSVRTVASLSPSASASTWAVPWLETVVPAAAARIVASIPMVTEPPAGMDPFQLTTLPTWPAVPLEAVTAVTASVAGTVSVNSSPELSG